MKKNKYKIIAVDFDGTLCTECYPRIGDANINLINALIQRRKYGDKLILWTCREETLLAEAIEWCKQYGLYFDVVNDNLEEVKQKYQHNSRKITADIYVDDKAFSWNNFVAPKYCKSYNKRKRSKHNGFYRS